MDEQLIAAYWNAVQHFGSEDLVMTLDLSSSDPDLICADRAEMVSKPDCPASLAKQMAKPAREMGPLQKVTRSSFWFAVVFPDGDIVVSAIGAELLTSGGDA